MGDFDFKDATTSGRRETPSGCGLWAIIFTAVVAGGLTIFVILFGLHLWREEASRRQLEKIRKENEERINRELDRNPNWHP